MQIPRSLSQMHKTMAWYPGSELFLSEDFKFQLSHDNVMLIAKKSVTLEVCHLQTSVHSLNIPWYL